MFKKFIVSLEGDAYKAMVFRTKKKILEVLVYGISSQLGAREPQRVLKGISGARGAFPQTFSLSPYSFFFLLKLIVNAKIFAQRVSYAEKPVTRKQRTSVWETFSCKSKSFDNMTCVSIKVSPRKVDVEYVQVTLAACANCLMLRLQSTNTVGPSASSPKGGSGALIVESHCSMA